MSVLRSMLKTMVHAGSAKKLRRDAGFPPSEGGLQMAAFFGGELFCFHVSVIVGMAIQNPPNCQRYPISETRS